MPELTDPQTAFVEELVSTGCTPTEAARRAGYADPGQESWRLMRKPHVVASIRELRERMVSGHAGNVAIATLIEIMTDKGASASARVSAARTVIEAAGDFDRSTKTPAERPLESLGADELAAMIRSLDGQIDARATKAAH